MLLLFSQIFTIISTDYYILLSVGVFQPVSKFTKEDSLKHVISIGCLTLNPSKLLIGTLQGSLAHTS